MGQIRRSAALFGVLIALAIPGAVVAEVIEVVSVDFHGQVDPVVDALSWSLDATGRFVALRTSSAFSDFPLGVGCGVEVYVRDRATGALQCVPGAFGGVITPDGRRVTYGTYTGDCGTYLYDLVDKTSTCLTLSSTGQPVRGGVYSMSDDGRVVVFSAVGANIAPPCVNPLADHFFVRDLAAGTTRCLDVSPDGSEPGYGVAYSVSLSGDGRFAAFVSEAYNLGTCVDPLLQQIHVFVRDLVTNAITCVDVAPDGSLADQGAYYAGVSISANGRFVAFASEATNLAPPCGGVHIGFELVRHVYVRDLLLGTTVCASSGPAGPGNHHSGAVPSTGGPRLSADARFVAFVSKANNLAAPCTEAEQLDDARGGQVYVRDLPLGALACLSVSAAGIPGNDRYTQPSYPVFSGDGRFVAFGSKASNLLPGLTGHHVEALLARVPRADLTVDVSLPTFGAGDTLVATATMTPGLGPVDGYAVLRTPDGGFLSLTLDGVVPGIAPVARGFTPFAFTGDLLRYTLTGHEPPGLYTMFSALTVPGTLTPVTDVHQTPFTIVSGPTTDGHGCVPPGRMPTGCDGLP